METAADITQATETLKSLGIALGLGLLVGLEREWANKRMAGIRTFPLVAVWGGLCAMMSEVHGGGIIVMGGVACVAMLALSNLAKWRRPEGPGEGLTSEMAVLVMYAVGVICVMGHWMEAMVVSGVVMVLLHAKAKLHAWVDRFGEGELREVARLVLIGLVILPLLPNREMGYLDVINPFKVWLLVVLIVGISLAAYLASKFVGGRQGALVSGILGGLISSTATTAGASRRSHGAPDSSRACAFIALVATAVVFARVMVEVVAAGGSEGRAMLAPLGVMLGWSALVAAGVGWRGMGESGMPTEDRAPSELKAAVWFALMYVAVLCGVAFAKERLGEGALYGVAAISGLTDMDAITLSTSQLVAAGEVRADQGWRVILLGGMSNLVFKAGMVAVLGTRRMLWPVLLGFSAIGVGAGLLAWGWP
ncbi:uncharacterized membrane protein (DUF4010 family) [Haloferula luteola]|uniref:Uncharacterized membrane protein (DUF4010 family) n=1 Tax=Haloferula luteola TaxID=595692 RepID=A0A840V002_9BACT|nr:MgtC/SapB family protein [Haloferula luteola]MBB5350406.1 uncharacterized membrane protein (DUF4010 family) [Haloferula luteola]